MSFECMTVSCRQSVSVSVQKYSSQPKCPYRLKCNSCQKYWSLRYNTWFDGSHLELWQALHLVYAFIEQKTVEQAMAEVGVAANTVVDWFHFCREVCNVVLLNRNEQIGGEGHVVEVDESHLRTRKYYRDRLSFGEREQVWVVGGIDRTTKQSLVVHVENRNAETLLPILHQYILPGTVVMTDGWRAYRRLSENGDLEHHTINHSLNFVDPNYPSIHTQTVERMWRSLKKVFPVGGRPTENLHLYISEFLYRQANPKLVPDLCPIFLTDIVKVYPGYGKPVDQSKG